MNRSLEQRLERLARGIELLTQRMEQPDLLTPDAAARALSVSRKTVDRMKASGKLRTVPMGKRWRVPRSEVVRLSTPRETRKTRRLPPAPYDAKAEYEKTMHRLGGRR